MFDKKLNSDMNSLKKAIYWINYKLFSNSLHGTHSPFVYKFLEEVVYKTMPTYGDIIYLHSSKSRSKKYNELILRMIQYFKINTILESSNKSETEFKAALDNLEVIELIIFNTSKINYSLYEHSLKKINECSIFVIDGIRSSDDQLNYWRKIQSDNRAIVTIDLFEIGIVFFRSQQPKENFLIDY
jgi:hypothetical protein